MATVKLNASQIELFISKAREHVADYRNRGGLIFIGGPREEQLLKCITADVEKYGDHLPGKVENSSLRDAVKTAVRIYRASDPYSTEEDLKIYAETRELVTYVLCKTESLETLLEESPGQYVWLVIATLMAVAGVDNTAACQAAAGYDTISEAKNEGVGGGFASIQEEAGKAASRSSHIGALSRIESVVKNNGFYPEELVPIRDAVEDEFPEYNEEAVKLMVAAAFATAMLDKGSARHTFEFKCDK